jgi:hypothetical protein
MLSHFRFIAPLLSKYDDGLSPLQYYDSAIQLARYSEREPTEREYEITLSAANAMKETCVHRFLSLPRLLTFEM